MDTNFTLQNSLSALPKTDFIDADEKYSFISAEIDLAIEKLIRDGQFNISKGIAKLSAGKNSALSLIDESIAKRYALETGWKIELEYSVSVVVKTPTYLYTICLYDEHKNCLSYKPVIFKCKNSKGAKITLEDELMTNVSGSITLDLTELLSKNNLHPYYCTDFEIEVSGLTFEIEKIDTEYKEKFLNITVINLQ